MSEGSPNMRLAPTLSDSLDPPTHPTLTQPDLEAISVGRHITQLEAAGWQWELGMSMWSDGKYKAIARRGGVTVYGDGTSSYAAMNDLVTKIEQNIKS